MATNGTRWEFQLLTHTHSHTQWEKEGERELEKERTRRINVNDMLLLSLLLLLLLQRLLLRLCYCCFLTVWFGSVSHSFVQSREHAYTLIPQSLAAKCIFFVAEKRDYLERRAHTTLFYFVFQLIGRHQHHRLHVRATTIFSLPLSFFPFYFSTTTNTTTKLLLNIFFFAVWADSHSIALVWKRVYVLCWCWCWCYVSVCVHCLLVCVCLCRCHHRARIHTDYFCFQHIKFTSHFAKRLTSLALSCNVARGNRAYVCVSVCACAYLQTRWEFDW